MEDFPTDVRELKINYITQLLSQTTRQTPLLKLHFCQLLRDSDYRQRHNWAVCFCFVLPFVVYQHHELAEGTESQWHFVAPTHHLNFRAHKPFPEAATTSCSFCCLRPGACLPGQPKAGGSACFPEAPPFPRPGMEDSKVDPGIFPAARGTVDLKESAWAA